MQEAPSTYFSHFMLCAENILLILCPKKIFLLLSLKNSFLVKRTLFLLWINNFDQFKKNKGKKFFLVFLFSCFLPQKISLIFSTKVSIKISNLPIFKRFSRKFCQLTLDTGGGKIVNYLPWSWNFHNKITLKIFYF